MTPGITACVCAAYTHYIERIGTRPGPMLDDYDQVVRDHRAYVIDDGGDIVGVLVLMDKEDGLLLDNVAVLPSRQGEGIGRRLVDHAESEARRLGGRAPRSLHPSADDREHRHVTPLRLRGD